MIKIVNEDDYQILVEGDRYRVTTISRVSDYVSAKDPKNDTGEVMVCIQNLPPICGLVIEEKQSGDEDNFYIAIATLHYNPTDGEVIFEDIGFRSINTLEDIEWKDLEEYLNCVQFAKQTILDCINQQLDVVEDEEEEDWDECDPDPKAIC